MAGGRLALLPASTIYHPTQFRSTLHCSPAIGNRNGVSSSPASSLGAARASRCKRRHGLAVAAAGAPDLDALLAGLEAPDIGGDLADLQAEQGAVFDDAGVAVHFKNDSRAMYALEHAGE